MVPPIVVKATVDQQQILIGQPFHLLLEATVPGNAQLDWPELPDSLPHFEWLEKGKMDTVAKTNETYYRAYFTVTSFDSGAWSIPQIRFQSGNNMYYTDSVRIQVGYSKFDPNQDYHDIKDIIDIPNPYARWIPWIVAAITILSLVLVVWLVRKKKLLQKLVAGVTGPRLSPYEDAVRHLEELEKQGFVLQDGTAKAFYTRLNDVFKLYVFRQMGISSLAETNEELIGEIRRLPVDHADFEELVGTLRISDFVKFAKYQPGASDNEQHWRAIRTAVEKLNKMGKEEETGK